MAEISSYLKPKVTFTPLARGRLRVNNVPGPEGKGVLIITRSRSKSLRKELINKDLCRLEPIGPTTPETSRTRPTGSIPIGQPPRKVPTAYIDQDGDVKCPGCGRYSYGSMRRIEPGREMRCGECSALFVPEKRLGKKSRIDPYGDVECPYCHREHYNVETGLMKCLRCGDIFEAVEH